MQFNKHVHQNLPLLIKKLLQKNNKVVIFTIT